jgi:hypothetical protein
LASPRKSSLFPQEERELRETGEEEMTGWRERYADELMGTSLKMIEEYVECKETIMRR